MQEYLPALAKYESDLMVYQATITANMAWTEEGEWRHHDGPARVLLLGGITDDTETLTATAVNTIVKELVKLAKAKSVQPPPRRAKRKLNAAMAFTATIDNNEGDGQQ
jgi:hypothetical protein